MKRILRAFCKIDSGAVTVDWVVLTAALVGLGMLVLIPVAFSTESATKGISDYITNIQVGYDKN